MAARRIDDGMKVARSPKKEEGRRYSVPLR
jgi:hypothetical protein